MRGCVMRASPSGALNNFTPVKMVLSPFPPNDLRSAQHIAKLGSICTVIPVRFMAATVATASVRHSGLKKAKFRRWRSFFFMGSLAVRPAGVGLYRQSGSKKIAKLIRKPTFQTAVLVHPHPAR
jgi:hypothetical protein